MIKVYLKQAWQLMKQNRFYSTVYILGTGLAISLVMVIAIVYHIKTADMAPEVNRHRTLVANTAVAEHVNGRGTNNAYLSYHTIKECFYTLKTPECVAVAAPVGLLKFFMGSIFANKEGENDMHEVYLGCTDANYWKVFRFSFLEGKPYSEEEFQSGYQKAVLSESLARKMFGKRDVVGSVVQVNGTDYIVGGVVKDVSTAMTESYADLWVPFTTVPTLVNLSMGENLVGFFTAYILAKSPSDFDAIRQEIDRNKEIMNQSQKEYKLKLGENYPPSQTILSITNVQEKKDYKDIILQYLFIALIFLLVPAVNLLGLTSSRMQERIEEFGVRKAFGANRPVLINQVLVENLLLTLLGGLVGLLISYMLVWMFAETLFSDSFFGIEAPVTISPTMLINFSVFFSALCVCILLNLLSSLFPVWNASRKQIVEALNDK
ncbi:ABC transporter permease [Parabacteroides sp. OttesenSCG-928-B22]|nr:ABC transporter permease [Parabacteroides sp. OttesenSCG-928-B22]